jgi:hypothetical protein
MIISSYWLVYLYTEDHTAKKGDNSIASLLIHHLEHQGIATAGEAFKELNNVFKHKNKLEDTLAGLGISRW